MTKAKKKSARKNARRRVAGKKSSTSPSKVEYRTAKTLSPELVQQLFRAAGWDGDLAKYSRKKVRTKLNRSHLVISAWQGKEMVGFASAVSDGVLCALVDNLLVHPAQRGRGIGRRLMRELTRELRRQGVEYVFGLGARSTTANRFFEGEGFRQIPWRVFLHARS